jgi:hypothetical protein
MDDVEEDDNKIDGVIDDGTEKQPPVIYNI